MTNNVVFTTSPYGTGTTSNSPIIALGEGWAYHMGHFLTEKKYGIQSGVFIEQSNNYSTNNPVAGLNSNLNLLEDFNPLSTNDVFRWIPQGLFYDLIDDRNDFGITANPLHPGDLVTGYTNQQLFGAIDGDITTLQEFRIRLLNNSNNNQAANVINLFGFYNY
jgi:hypothetical protein